MSLTCKYFALHYLSTLCLRVFSFSTASTQQQQHAPMPRRPERSALNSSSIAYDTSMNVAKWENQTDCCLWDGITCDDSGKVVGLNLSYSGLSGNIDAIINLRHLQSLNLAENNFRLTPIPSGLEKLSNLTHLNLSYSCFSDQIPEGISRLVRLESLDLSTIFFCELPPTFNDPCFNKVFAFEEQHRPRLDRPNLYLSVSTLTLESN